MNVEKEQALAPEEGLAGREKNVAEEPRALRELLDERVRRILRPVRAVALDDDHEIAVECREGLLEGPERLAVGQIRGEQRVVVGIHAEMPRGIDPTRERDEERSDHDRPGQPARALHPPGERQRHEGPRPAVRPLAQDRPVPQMMLRDLGVHG